ncbi:hypothetical protein Q1695_012326 [Nippostrongylus brasiliensis]|nr:hypothetical protein Q1695_012326 [Nippostrongylus brasiliensis]
MIKADSNHPYKSACKEFTPFLFGQVVVMHSRTSFIESVYYSAARRKEADDDDRWVENGGEQLPICQKCQTPVAVKKHLLSAGARFSTQDHMTPRTMIESQYCNSGILANYAINRKSNTTGFDDAGDRDDYRSSTMLSPFAQTQQVHNTSSRFNAQLLRWE